MRSVQTRSPEAPSKKPSPPTTASSPSQEPIQVSLPEPKKLIQKELERPEVQKQLQQAVKQAMEDLADKQARPTKSPSRHSPRGASRSARPGAGSGIPANTASTRQKKMAQMQKKAGAHRLETLIQQSQPPLSPAQAQALKDAFACMPEKTQKAIWKGPSAAATQGILCKLARGGELGRLMGSLKKGPKQHRLKQMALGRMIMFPQKARALVDSALMPRVQLLADEVKGPMVQQKALDLVAMGGDLQGVLKHKGFYKQGGPRKMVILAMMSKNQLSLNGLTETLKQTKQIETLVADFNKEGTSAATKTALMTQLAKTLQECPKAFALLHPPMQVALGGVLVQRLGTSPLGKEGLDSDCARRALGALKKSMPTSYKKLFGKLFEAAKRGPGYFSSFLESSSNNVAKNDALAAFSGAIVDDALSATLQLAGKGFSTLGSAAGGVVGIGVSVVLAAKNSRNGVDAIGQVTSAFATATLGTGIGATLGLGGAAAIGAGAVIGAAPAALVAVWNAFCKHGVATDQMKQSVAWMQTDELKP